MRSHTKTAKPSPRAGHSVIELALFLPLLAVLALGATDFARAFVEAQIAASAAHSGASFGARRHIDSVLFTEQEQRAIDDASGVSGAQAASEMFCDCPTDPGNAVSCVAGSCGVYGQPRVYVKTRVSKTFQTLGRYPGVPHTTNIGGVAYMRVQ